MSFIKTFSGKHFYYDRINKDDIDINDIAVYEYMAWDMTLGWIVWQQRAGIHFSTMSQQEVK